LPAISADATQKRKNPRSDIPRPPGVVGSLAKTSSRAIARAVLVRVRLQILRPFAPRLLTMVMSDLYIPVRTAHVAFVLISGSLFAVRGLAVIGKAQWAMVRPLRLLSYTIDTLLVGAATLLLYILRLNPLTTPWLATKLSLLGLYVLLGSLALKRAPDPRSRLVSYVGALLCFGLMVSVAITHDPMGVVRPWLQVLGNSDGSHR